MRFSSESGQATVEAAVMLPVLFVVFGLFLQPTILLYDKAVMSATASETCRLVATNTANDAVVKAYAKRRLGAVPNADIFHVGGKKGWKVTFSGPDEKGRVSVKIVSKAQPLPLFGVIAGLGNSIAKDGRVKLTVKQESSCVPVWAVKAGTPDVWIGAWK